MITVQLVQDGPITEADEAMFERRDGIVDNENERTTWVEYWIPGTTDRAVHRSVHVHLKRPMVSALGETGAIGG